MQKNSPIQENGRFPIHQLLNFALVFFVLCTLGLIAVFYERPTISETEKRELAKLPEFSAEALFAGTYTRDLSAFFADTFPLREQFVGLAGAIRENGGLRYDDIRLHEGTAGDLEQIAAPPDSSSSISEEAAPNPDGGSSSEAEAPSVSDDGTQGVKVGAVFIYKGKGYQIFGGTDAMGRQYAAAVNSYQQAVGDQAQVYNLIVPSPIEFALPDRYKSITTPERPKIENIYSHLDPEVKAVDVYDTLSEHRDEYLYFATDHHWTALGAYYAYVEFCKTAGLEPVPLESMEKRTLNGFLGSLYSETQDSKLKENIDHVDYYMIKTPHQAYHYRTNEPYTAYPVPLYGEYAKPVNSYSVFLHGDFPMVRIDTDLKNGRRIVLVKESYGNAFAPFLVNHFEQVFVVDARYFQTGLVELIRDNNVTDLLFLNNIFAAHTPYHINNLSKVMYQTYVPYVPETSAPAEPESQAPSEEAPPEEVLSEEVSSEEVSLEPEDFFNPDAESDGGVMIMENEGPDVMFYPAESHDD